MADRTNPAPVVVTVESEETGDLRFVAPAGMSIVEASNGSERVLQALVASGYVTGSGDIDRVSQAFEAAGFVAACQLTADLRW
ncbi:MAG TPA: hypothetical protein VJ608_06730 [Albitalea sp.]|nr:hypothetical protein [Albitalea sp.]